MNNEKLMKKIYSYLPKDAKYLSYEGLPDKITPMKRPIPMIRVFYELNGTKMSFVASSLLGGGMFTGIKRTKDE